MKYTLSIGLLSVLLFMGASCGKTADTATNDTAKTIANAQATTTSNTNTTTEVTNSTNTAVNTNKTAGVTTTNDAAAGLEEPATDTSGISASDVAKHSTKADCWTSISGKVYDITKFIARHPGGSVITQTCGIDGTQLFATQGGEGQHSGTARSQLATFEIGTLK